MAPAPLTGNPIPLEGVCQCFERWHRIRVPLLAARKCCIHRRRESSKGAGLNRAAQSLRLHNSAVKEFLRSACNSVSLSRGNEETPYRQPLRSYSAEAARLLSIGQESHAIWDGWQEPIRFRAYRRPPGNKRQS